MDTKIYFSKIRLQIAVLFCSTGEISSKWIVILSLNFTREMNNLLPHPHTVCVRVERRESESLNFLYIKAIKIKNTGILAGIFYKISYGTTVDHPR